ncbi:TonB-dependent receptor domain-containing protein [Novosphingobium sp. CECT 9465]|uniref:TonB-dependent receptor domain-containing protein n=1 Tax=Novosphingobium sp. CECT 9465 TaxID=2829794 RepID=UPI001E604F02|nr:TonB-dependent receptor [Novosphingobium sp. CECT 9465]CAH0495528.1 Vitamin B12 transporter BtuB [Novosphingobium sp. CECT 9465]
MKNWHYLVCTVLASGITGTAYASEAEAKGGQSQEQTPVVTKAPAGKAFSTGVAKGRDLLDTAISASVIDEVDLKNISATSIAGILQNIPGIRSETSDIDGVSSITVRGLPLAATGSKFLQIQEDGLPVLEFGDISFATPDTFVRADLTLSQIQVIRGGSASTFSSNSPGGVVNLLSKTGETQGGTIQLSSGLGHDLNRIDLEYGSPLGEGWRFHVGGFYRQGEGPRELGYDGFRGGQVKFNVTRQLADGYIRIYAKYLDDRQINYSQTPVLLTGTNDKPVITDIPGLSARGDVLASGFTSQFLAVDRNNGSESVDSRDGIHAIVKALGFEAQFDVAGWTVSNRFRHADIGGEYNESSLALTAPASVIATTFGGPGATLSYATGPNAGQQILAPDSLNGNGLLAVRTRMHATLDDISNTTNDLRASRVWPVGGGKLTTTMGLYTSSQRIESTWGFVGTVSDVVGGGKSAAVDVTTAAGIRQTDGGTQAYGFSLGLPLATAHDSYNLTYRVTAPYGSINYQIGKLAIGGSVRFDRGTTKGTVISASLGDGRVGVGSVDVNGDGVISAAESRSAILPLDRPGTVDYGYDYLSYSTGVNYRMADALSVFARYSRGARANANRIVRVPNIDFGSGQLADPALAFGVVKQAEGGVKFRQDGLSVFVTGFWASTVERTVQVAANATGESVILNIDRTYSAKGVELESEVRRGPFSMMVGATWTRAAIDKDVSNPALNGNRPRHIPTLSFQARPQVQLDRVTFGTVINGTASSFAQDTNLLKQPGYVLVSPFLQVRPTERFQIGINAFNVFNKLAIVQLASAAIPASGIANAQVMNGRTVTASARFSF